MEERDIFWVKMEERDIFWVKEIIDNGEVEFSDGVGASDNPMMFRFEDEYIVQADECLYMNDSLEITKIDIDNVVKEITEVAEKLLIDIDNKLVYIDNYLSLEAKMYIDCLLIDKMVNMIDFGEYCIDVEHNLIRK